MSVIFLFIDGVGLGDEVESNPFWSDKWEGFSALAGGHPMTQSAIPIEKSQHVSKAVDATLGVEGLPQSGTGQATLFSGENAAAAIDKHFGPFPHSGTKHLLREQSLFNKAQAAGKSCNFINAYPKIFFKKARQRSRWTCTTLMTKSAGIELNGPEQVKNETAVTAGLTQKAWKENLGIDVPVITPEKAAKRIIKQTEKYDLLLHEYYLTDKAGHSQEQEKADLFIERYDRFLGELLSSRPDNTTIVLCSDHGNLEDLSIKTHTLNPVPLFACGPGAGVFREAESIMDVTPGILDILGE